MKHRNGPEDEKGLELKFIGLCKQRYCSFVTDPGVHD